MTDSSYHDWPFRPDWRTPAQRVRWWETCYLPGPVDYQLLDLSGWTLIVGGPGSGKSVALSAWIEQQPATSLIVDYPLDCWPGGARAWAPNDPRHLPQMLASATMGLYGYLEDNPHLAPGLAPSQRVHLRALIEQLGDASLYHQLIFRFASPDHEAYRATEVPDSLREAPKTQRDMELSVKNLIWLAKGLGLDQVVLTFDLPRHCPPETQPLLATMLRGLDIVSNSEFLVVAAVPESSLRERRPASLARSRVSVVTPSWDEARCRAAAARHICLALDAEPDRYTLEDFAAPELLHQAGQIIRQEYGEPSPTGWVDLAESLLYWTHRAYEAKKLPMPIPVEETHRVLRSYFYRHMPLWPDAESHGVWRGPRFIRLDDQPLNFLLLLERRNGPVNWDDFDMQSLVGSKKNVHSIASRVRKAIEPFPKQPVYLMNDRGGGGYHLERPLK
jgi:hypothetical protein